MRASEVLAAGGWSGPVIDTVVLDFDGRHRRRLAMTGEGGTTFLLDLAEAAALKDGDGLKLETGEIIQVVAASEHLLEVTCETPHHMLRVAWHLGNRHLPTEILKDRIHIRFDHVIAEMLKGLGATVNAIDAPFQPEGGAYGHGQVQGHDHPHHAHDGADGHSHG